MQQQHASRARLTMAKRVKIIILAIILVFLLAGVIFLWNNLMFSGSEISIENQSVKMTPTEKLKIGFITDAHCYADQNKKSGEWTLNWRCQKPLEAFAKKMNNDFKPDFVIENGDFIDGKDERSRGTFIDANNIFNTISAPKYHVMGNHEARSFYKNEWLELVGYEKTYYYFDVKGYRIIVLDANHKMMQDGKTIDADPENESYPGLLDSDQITWLLDLFQQSKNYQKLIFVHQPLATEERKTQEQLFVNGEKLRKLFSANNVLAVFSGHIERFCLMEEDGVEYYVSQGFWKDNRGLAKEHRFKDEGVFGEIVIDESEVIFTAFHNPELSSDSVGNYQSMILTTENANCNDGSALFYEEKKEPINEEVFN